MKALNCPKGHGPMELKKLHKEKTFKGVDIGYMTEAFVCPVCDLEAGTVQTASVVQRAIADAYRAKVDLLTSQEIKFLRQAKGLTQRQLADSMNVGIASIKRWETGMIQSKSMDHALRMQLQGDIRPDNYDVYSNVIDFPSRSSQATPEEKKQLDVSTADTGYYLKAEEGENFPIAAQSF